MKRLGCAKSLRSRRNIAAELPSTSVGLGFCKLPKPHGACGMLCLLFRLAKDRGRHGDVYWWALSRAKNGVVPLFVQRVLGPFGEMLCHRAKDSSASRL